MEKGIIDKNINIENNSFPTPKGVGLKNFVIPFGTDIEYILCAAIWYDDKKERPHQPKNIKTGIVVCGQRHCNAFVILYEIAEPDYKKQKVIQGFLTSKNRFVDRTEGLKIAIAAQQVKKQFEKDGILYSEDLY